MPVDQAGVEQAAHHRRDGGLPLPERGGQLPLRAHRTVMQCEKCTGLCGGDTGEVDAAPVGPDPQPVRGLLEQQEHALVRFVRGGVTHRVILTDLTPPARLPRLASLVK
jgi:hypothetical protein